jgi:HK97 family phage major capsid protein
MTKEQREKMAKAIADARAIKEKAGTAKRALTGEELGQIEGHLTEYKRIDSELKESARGKQIDDDIEAAEAELSRSAGRSTEPEAPETPSRGRGSGRDAGRGNGGEGTRELRWKTRGGNERCITFDSRHDTSDYARDYHGAYLRHGKITDLLSRCGEPQRREDRDLQADSYADGGALLAPTEMIAGILKKADDAVYVRQFATVFQVKASQNLGQVSLDADPDDGEWTSELGTGTNDTATKFGRRELNPTPLAKRIKISKKLVRMLPSLPSFIEGRLAYKFGTTLEKNLLLGDGANKPLGLMVASNNGISTSRDVTTGNTATQLKPDNLIACKYFLKEAYRKSARWMMHRDVVLQVALMKDGNGQYLWRQGLTAGDPDTILALPVAESEYMPNTLTSGKYTHLLGDLSFYVIAEALQLDIQVLLELYAETGQIGYIGRMEADGMPMLEEAFVRGKLG